METNWTLRLGTLSDVDAVRDLTREAYSKWISLIGREPLPMTVDFRAALQSHRFDLLYRGEDLVALIETIRCSDHLYVENLAVSPRYQKQGLGRRLLFNAEGVAREAGFNAIRLMTNETFTGNVKFYLSGGYKIEGREPIAGGVRVDMLKVITDRS